jgi:subtilase family serine protease
MSSGDSGYGVEYPAASRYVTAVGGTTLKLSGNTRLTETVWSGSGSGCSAYEPKPSWQTDMGCGRRTVADVSADADPSTGAAEYDSTRYQGRSGWFQVGGTSLSAPLIGGVYALGNSAVNAGSYPYAHTSSLFDVTSGSNGSCGTYLCTGDAGFDGPTGLGTPNGTGGF